MEKAAPPAVHRHDPSLAAIPPGPDQKIDLPLAAPNRSQCRPAKRDEDARTIRPLVRDGDGDAIQARTTSTTSHCTESHDSTP